MADQYRVKGAFFESDKPSGPAFTGFVEIDGIKTHIALWPKTSQSGTNYFQVSEDKRKNQAQAQPAAPVARSPFARKQQQAPPARPSNDMDDDIPFAPEFR